MPWSPRPRQAHAAPPAQFLAFVVACAELLVAHWQRHAFSGPDDRAISRAQFHAWSVDDDVLLWMLYHDHIEHLKATPDFSGPTPAGSLILSEQSCFVLKDKGAAFAEAFLADILLPQVEGAFDAAWDQ